MTHRMPSDAASICTALDLDPDELSLMFEVDAIAKLNALANHLDHFSSEARSLALERIQHVLWIAEAFAGEWERRHPEEEAPGDSTGGDPIGSRPGASFDGSESGAS